MRIWQSCSSDLNEKMHLSQCLSVSEYEINFSYFFCRYYMQLFYSGPASHRFYHLFLIWVILPSGWQRGFWSQAPRSKSWLCYLPAVCAWASDLTSLSLSFHVCRIGIIIFVRSCNKLNNPPKVLSTVPGTWWAYISSLYPLRCHPWY